jgi:choline dehydrogenase
MDTFDYLVVGAGSAGCAVAARLSEDTDVTVAVVEAGSRTIPSQVQENIQTPWHWGLVQNSAVDWAYRSVPQRHLNGRRIPEPRGRVPGGTSTLYILMHIRGHRSDFDNWAYNGCPGWSYEDVLPYFQKSEDQEDDTNPLAGKGGPLSVLAARLHEPNPTSRAFYEACLELGFARTPDFNGPRMEGVGWHHLNIKNGKRHDMATAYLYPALENRQNISLIDNAQTTRLLFEGRRCTGVEYRQGNESKRVDARREVIVCAGAIDSPKILMLSGIGDGDRLAQFGIPSLAHVPGVGENFHNHVLVPVICVSSQRIPDPTTSMSEAALFYRSAAGWPGPDIQMAFVHGDPQQVTNPDRPSVMVMLPGVVRPLSRGWLRLAGPDPMAAPLINPNYLAAESDFVRLTDAVRLARRLYATQALGSWAQTEVLPGPDYPDEALGDFVRQFAESYHHQAGSCRMGMDALAVVDPRLRVHGIAGLRVADASVMPAVVSGNCHSAIVMIAEKVADMIKEDRRAAPAGATVTTTPARRPALRFHHVSLTCSDPIATERFYTKNFGFSRARVVPLGQDDQIVFLQGPGIYLELFRATESRPVGAPEGDGFPWPSVRNISFEVDDVDAKLAAMGADADIAFGPLSFDDFIEGWRSAWLRDPDGNLVQITQGYVDQANPPVLPTE